jgi:hypothetical protein
MNELFSSPYSGTEKTNFYEYLRIGVLTQIDYNAPQQGGSSRRQTYGTAQVQWVDTRLGTVDQIPLTFPASGQGWGIFAYPRTGDIVVVGFRPGGYAVIVGYLQGNPYYERGSIDAQGNRLPPSASEVSGGEILYRPTRYLTGGEVFLKSFQGAEIYMDRFANLRTIIRQVRDDVEDNNVQNLTIDSATEKEKIWDVTLGTARLNDLFLIAANEETATIRRKDEKKQSFNQQDVNYDATHKSGFNVQVDAEGSMSVTVPKDIQTTTVGKETHIANDLYTIKVSANGKEVSIVLKPDGSMVATDAAGGIVTMDGIGGTTVKSPNGTMVDIRDNNVIVQSQNITLTGTNVNIGASGSMVNLGGPLAIHPAVLADILAPLFNTHTHVVPGVVNGPGSAISAPPVIPLTPAQIGSVITKVG